MSSNTLLMLIGEKPDTFSTKRKKKHLWNLGWRFANTIFCLICCGKCDFTVAIIWCHLELSAHQYGRILQVLSHGRVYLCKHRWRLSHLLSGRPNTPGEDEAMRHSVMRHIGYIVRFIGSCADCAWNLCNYKEATYVCMQFFNAYIVV